MHTHRIHKKNAKGVTSKGPSSALSPGKSVVSVILFTEISMDSGPSCAAFRSFAPDVDHGPTLAQTMDFVELNRLM